MTTYIQLTKGYLAAIDDDLVDIINQYLWHALDGHPRIVYAARWLTPKTYPRKAIRMHHVVLNVTSEELKENNLVADHIDRDGLNNTRENLRIVSRSDNIKNSDNYEKTTWIRWDGYRGRYKVVMPNGAFIKWCKTLEEAVEVRDAHHQNA